MRWCRVHQPRHGCASNAYIHPHTLVIDGYWNDVSTGNPERCPGAEVTRVLNPNRIAPRYRLAKFGETTRIREKQRRPAEFFHCAGLKPAPQLPRKCARVGDPRQMLAHLFFDLALDLGAAEEDGEGGAKG